EEVGRAAEIPEVEREADVLLHRAAEKAHLATDGGRGAQHALHPMHVGAEHRHRDAALGARSGEDARERFAHLALRDAGPGAISRRSAEIPCSAIFSLTTPRVKRVPYTGVCGHSRKRYGSAPT